MKTILLLGLLIGSASYAKNKKSVVPPQVPVPAVEATTQNLPQELKVGVKGMVCAFCAQGIEKNFKRQPEVSSVEVSLENKYVLLKFKQGQTLARTKIIEILKEAGYESVFGD